jgi:molybdate transport system ATP-binding protein/molybdate transport system permease protein
VALEVQVAKKLPEFKLEVSFKAGNVPLSILGASGAGKSMLLRCIAGLERPDSGRIVLNDRALFDSGKDIHVPARDRRVGILFQHYALFPHRTLGDNVGFGLRHLPALERRQRVAVLLERLHIAGLEHRYPREVSGGEQQRAALARALAIEPEALLLDEPLSALDTHLRSQMEAQLQETFAGYARPTLLVTHNIEEAYRLGEQLLVLARGRVAACGPKDEIFRNPQTLEVAQLTGCKNFSQVRWVDQNSVEALDWNCKLRMPQQGGGNPTHVGIRAHHIEFGESRETIAGENVFPCWVVRASETPFGVTLYLRLHKRLENNGEYHLQAEVMKEKWRALRDQPSPWNVRLSPENLFLLRE